MSRKGHEMDRRDELKSEITTVLTTLSLLQLELFKRFMALSEAERIAEHNRVKAGGDPWDLWPDGKLLYDAQPEEAAYA
jgi:hypothetical protein